MANHERSVRVGCLQLIIAEALFAISSTSLCCGQTPSAETAAADAHDQNVQPTLKGRPRYVVSPGDVLQVSFPLSPEFDQLLTVAPDGFVSLRGVGDLSVMGKSLPELRPILRTAYSGILHDPLVNVDLKDFQKPHFTVAGEVSHPGKYELREEISAAEALALAGGPTTNAKSSQVLLFRRVPGAALVEVRKLNLKQMLNKGNLREDIYLDAGDMLYVPKSTISKISRFLPTSSLGLYSSGIP
jgi:polysaccharide export outer membrane protein